VSEAPGPQKRNQAYNLKAATLAAMPKPQVSLSHGLGSRDRINELEASLRLHRLCEGIIPARLSKDDYKHWCYDQCSYQAAHPSGGVWTPWAAKEAHRAVWAVKTDGRAAGLLHDLYK
jgi:hypothetical protein